MIRKIGYLFSIPALILPTIFMSGLACAANLSQSDSIASKASSSDSLWHPYAALGGGYSNTEMSYNYREVNNKANYSLSGASYQGIVGLQFRPATSKFRLAAEIFLSDVNNATAVDGAAVTPVPTYQQHSSKGARLVPQYQFRENELFFILLGAVSTNFTVQHSYNADLNYSQNTAGFQTGIGAMWNFNEYLGLRAQYEFTAYSQMQFKGGVGIGADNETTSPISNAVTLALQLTL